MRFCWSSPTSRSERNNFLIVLSGSHCLILLPFQQDLPNAMDAAQLTEKLNLHSLQQRKWNIQATCALTAEGLFEGLDWIANQIAKL